MKKKIIILGSTGSIGKNTFNLIMKDKKNFEIKLLSTNKNISEIIKQAKISKVKDLIINDYDKYILAKKKYKNLRVNFHNSFSIIDKLFKKREIFYSMISLVGLDGLKPTLQLIRYSQNIAIVNKESLICGWTLIKKKLKKNKTNFIPVDSEHYSIFSLIEKNLVPIEKIYITASGGPFLNRKKNNFSKITVSDALRHPSWRMGKKISIDSATMMNKVFELIEAKKIFNLDLKKIDILINPNSYVHAIVIFNNGTIKFLAHETRMDIPIFNSIYQLNNNAFYKTKNIDLNKINNLNLSQPNIKHFKTLNILKLIPSKDSLFETVLISVNDELVRMFLNNEIKYEKLLYYLLKIIKFPNFKKYCKVRPNSIKDILKTNKLAKNFVKNYVKYKKY